MQCKPLHFFYRSVQSVCNELRQFLGLFLLTDKKKKNPTNAWMLKFQQCPEWWAFQMKANTDESSPTWEEKRRVTMNSVTYSPRPLQPGMKPPTICSAYSYMWWLIESDVMWIRKKTGYIQFCCTRLMVHVHAVFSSTFPETDDV